MHFSKELIQAAEDLELVPKSSVPAHLVGAFKSRHKGAGMQFKEFRRYEPGDDVRHISWSVTARTGKATIKVYEEDREINTLLLVDISGSSLFGFEGKKRIETYQSLVALFGLAAINQGNGFGALFFDDGPVQYLPPRRNRNHLFAALKQLEGFELRGRKSDLGKVLKAFSAQLKTPAIVVILSDFLCPEFAPELAQFAAQHEVILVSAKHAMERGEGIREIFEVEDPETGTSALLDGASVSFRRELGKQHRRHRDAVQAAAQGAGADYLEIDSNENPLQKAVDFFRSRNSRVGKSVASGSRARRGLKRA